MKNARGASKTKPVPRALTVRPQRCRAETREGKPCPAHPVRGEGFCYWHIPGNASKKGSIGGRRRAIFRPEGLEPMATPQNVADLSRLVMQTLVEVRSQKLDVKVATCIFYGIGTARAVLETADLDARLKALEERQESVEAARARVQ